MTSVLRASVFRQTSHRLKIMTGGRGDAAEYVATWQTSSVSDTVKQSRHRMFPPSPGKRRTAVRLRYEPQHATTFHHQRCSQPDIVWTSSYLANDSWSSGRVARTLLIVGRSATAYRGRRDDTDAHSITKRLIVKGTRISHEVACLSFRRSSRGKRPPQNVAPRHGRSTLATSSAWVNPPSVGA